MKILDKSLVHFVGESKTMLSKADSVATQSFFGFDS